MGNTIRHVMRFQQWTNGKYGRSQDSTGCEMNRMYFMRALPMTDEEDCGYRGYCMVGMKEVVAPLVRHTVMCSGMTGIHHPRSGSSHGSWEG